MKLQCGIEKHTGKDSKKTKYYISPDTLTHESNPSYLRGGEQEDCGQRPAQASQQCLDTVAHPKLQGEAK
jgi:hypothetical protein